jgi:hypothetical protein
MVNEEINKDIVNNHVVDCDDDTNQCKFGDRQNDFEMKSEADNIDIINEEMNKDTVDYQVVDSDDQCKCDVGDNDLEINSEANNIEIINEEMNNDTVDNQVVNCDDTNQCKCDDTENDLDISEVEGAEKVLHPCNDMNLDVESCTLFDNSNKLDHVEVNENIAIPIEEKVPDSVIFLFSFLVFFSGFLFLAILNICHFGSAGHYWSGSFGFASQRKRSKFFSKIIGRN